MRRFARWVVTVTMFGAAFGAAGSAAGETPSFDSGTCFGARSCRCGYVCVTGYCAYRGPVTECGDWFRPCSEPVATIA